MDITVAFVVFNRPEQTARVFSEIARARPRRLFIIADGPRDERERHLCATVRKITEEVNWQCEIQRNYADENMGCRNRVSTGLNWVFENVGEAIVLEDDCLPHPKFFQFCAENLARYRNDPRVGHICGSTFRAGPLSGDSYSFSIYASVWGWATWRRAWQYYDVDLKRWPELRASGWHKKIFLTRGEARFFEIFWDKLYEGQMNTWDGQWQFACLANHLLSIRPAVNLVSNIGFGKGIPSTHTGFDHPIANLPHGNLTWPLRHPETPIADRESDAELALLAYKPPSVLWVFLTQKLLNRYWYGGGIRQLPWIGKVWAKWRNGMKSLAAGKWAG